MLILQLINHSSLVPTRCSLKTNNLFKDHRFHKSHKKLVKGPKKCSCHVLSEAIKSLTDFTAFYDGFDDKLFKNIKS